MNSFFLSWGVTQPFSPRCVSVQTFLQNRRKPSMNSRVTTFFEEVTLSTIENLVKIDSLMKAEYLQPLQTKHEPYVAQAKLTHLCLIIAYTNQDPVFRCLIKYFKRIYQSEPVDILFAIFPRSVNLILKSYDFLSKNV